MDYRVIAEQMGEVGELCVERAGIEPGMTVLDVACGTGNATIPAALSGARVTGLDTSADLLAIARERAADAMVEVDWVEADLRELPFPDDGFDRALCVFGPLDERLLSELRRVSRGAVAVASWSPDSVLGRVSGSPDGLRGERRELELRGDSVEAVAGVLLDPRGGRERLVRYLSEANESGDGRLRVRCEYVVALL